MLTTLFGHDFHFYNQFLYFGPSSRMNQLNVDLDLAEFYECYCIGT